MNKTCARFALRYLPFLLFLLAFFLVIVINIKVFKTNTSFFALFFRTFAIVIALFFAKKIFNIEEVFFFYFSNDVDNYYKKILAIALFPSFMMPKISLIVLILFISLVDRRLLLSN